MTNTITNAITVTNLITNVITNESLLLLPPTTYYLLPTTYYLYYKLATDAVPMFFGCNLALQKLRSRKHVPIKKSGSKGVPHSMNRKIGGMGITIGSGSNEQVGWQWLKSCVWPTTILNAVSCVQYSLQTTLSLFPALSDRNA